MIQLTINLSDLDYDSLLSQYLPQMTEKLRESGNPVAMLLSNGMPASMAQNIVRGLPQNVKDQLAADLLNTNAKKLMGKIEQTARANGVGVSVSNLRAEVKK